MQRIQSFFHWAIIGTVMGHMLCCGLPTLVSILSLVSGLGLMATMPTGLLDLHDVIHDYEFTIIIFSGTMVAIGWLLHTISHRMSCVEKGCSHPPCNPQKKRSKKLLILATGLFLINLAIYYGIDHCVHCPHPEH